MRERTQPSLGWKLDGAGVLVKQKGKTSVHLDSLEYFKCRSAWRQGQNGLFSFVRSCPITGLSTGHVETDALQPEWWVSSPIGCSGGEGGLGGMDGA